MIDLKVVVAGAGAAGIACAKILHAAGVRDLIVVDSKGVLHPSRDNLHPVKAEMAAMTNPRGISGSLADAMAGADVFIGVSGGSVDPALVETMGRSRSSSRWPTRPRRSTRGRRLAAAPPWWPPAAATTPTRSTTCWRSRASSSARWTAGRDDQRGDEGRRGARHRRRGRRGRTARRVHRPEHVQP